MTPDSDSFKSNPQIKHYQQRFETVLKAFIEKAPIEPTALKEVLSYSLFPGGKRIRPLLVYFGGEFVQASLEALDVIAISIELMHSYSLIHDDLPAMDNDDMRRGKPSCHQAFSESTAILVGDGLQALAVETILKDLSVYLPIVKVHNIALNLLQSAGFHGMVKGQYLDLIDNPPSSVTLDDLIAIQSHKTGELFLSCFRMACEASPSTPHPEQNSLEIVGKHLGLAFQMQDDYLDHYANPAFLGKGRSSDLANKKMTMANFYSKAELFSSITTHFETAREALIPFPEKNQNLLTLLELLEQRSRNVIQN